MAERKREQTGCLLVQKTEGAADDRARAGGEFQLSGEG